MKQVVNSDLENQQAEILKKLQVIRNKLAASTDSFEQLKNSNNLSNTAIELLIVIGIMVDGKSGITNRYF